MAFLEGEDPLLIPTKNLDHLTETVHQVACLHMMCSRRMEPWEPPQT